MIFSDEAWTRLGRLLKERRVQLNPEYRNRLKFAAEAGLNERLVADIEQNRRTTYRDTSLQAVEVAYQLEPGSLLRALEGGELTPQETHRTGSSAISASTGVRVAKPDDSHVTFEVTVEADLTMEEAVESLGDLTINERLLISNLQILGFGPHEVKGSVLLLRSQVLRHAGPHVDDMRKRA